jgi:hypothetical protein
MLFIDLSICKGKIRHFVKLCPSCTSVLYICTSFCTSLAIYLTFCLIQRHKMTAKFTNLSICKTKRPARTRRWKTNKSIKSRVRSGGDANTAKPAAPEPAPGPVPDPDRRAQVLGRTEEGPAAKHLHTTLFGPFWVGLRL